MASIPDWPLRKIRFPSDVTAEPEPKQILRDGAGLCGRTLTGHMGNRVIAIPPTRTALATKNFRQAHRGESYADKRPCFRCTGHVSDDLYSHLII
jgi:hypothetical protein